MEKSSIRNGLPLTLQKVIYIFSMDVFPVAMVSCLARERLSSDM